MILTDTDILQRVSTRDFIFYPKFDREMLGSNSYDFTLGEVLAEYPDEILDIKQNYSDRMTYHTIPKEGFVLHPGRLYLGNTNERVDAGLQCVPMLEGKSSLGRYGIDVHATAGFGDVGFSGHWTLEISVKVPVKIYANIPVAQVWFIMTLSDAKKPYNFKVSAKYANQPAKPIPSRYYLNFNNGKGN